MPQFESIKKEIKACNFDELRTDCDNYFEAVIVRDELSRLTGTLNNFFGLPVFPSKNRLSNLASRAVNSFGGIQPGQTLYSAQAEKSGQIYAMLWPWQDGMHTTVKIFQK